MYLTGKLEYRKNLYATNKIKIYDSIAFITDSTNGLQIANVSDVNNIVFLGSYNVPPSSANDVTLVGNTAFIAYNTQGLQIVDVTNFSKPVKVSNFTIGGQQEARGITVDNVTAYLAYSGLGLQILNVSDIKNPFVLGSYAVPLAGTIQGLLSGIVPHGAQSVLIHNTYAFVAYAVQGLQIIDIQNLTNPVPISSFLLPSYYGAQSLIILNSIIFLSYGEKGLQIPNVSNPLKPLKISNYTLPKK